MKRLNSRRPLNRAHAAGPHAVSGKEQRVRFEVARVEMAPVVEEQPPDFLCVFDALDARGERAIVGACPALRMNRQRGQQDGGAKSDGDCGHSCHDAAHLTGGIMNRLAKFVACAGVAVVTASAAAAQSIVMQKTLSLGLAKTIAEATLAECKSKGFTTSAVVVDRAGQVLVMLRDEGATAQTAEMARRKAFTARMFRTSTLEFQKRTQDPTYAAQRDVDRHPGPRRRRADSDRRRDHRRRGQLRLEPAAGRCLREGRRRKGRGVAEVASAMNWLFFAFVSAAFAALTAILAKIGVEGISSTLATAVRTLVIVLFAWAISAGRGELPALSTVSRRSYVFLVLSGLATGASWLAYYRALQLAPASRVAPIDKLSLPLTIVLAAVFLSESVGWKLGAGVALMTVGALLTIS